jgi:hypothetical protein
MAAALGLGYVLTEQSFNGDLTWDQPRTSGCSKAWFLTACCLPFNAGRGPCTGVLCACKMCHRLCVYVCS